MGFMILMAVSVRMFGSWVSTGFSCCWHLHACHRHNTVWSKPLSGRTSHNWRCLEWDPPEYSWSVKVVFLKFSSCSYFAVCWFDITPERKFFGDRWMINIISLTDDRAGAPPRAGNWKDHWRDSPKQWKFLEFENWDSTHQCTAKDVPKIGNFQSPCNFNHFSKSEFLSFGSFCILWLLEIDAENSRRNVSWVFSFYPFLHLGKLLLGLSSSMKHYLGWNRSWPTKNFGTKWLQAPESRNVILEKLCNQALQLLKRSHTNHGYFRKKNNEPSLHFQPTCKTPP